MNATLLKSLVALTPTCIVFLGSVVAYSKGRTIWCFLQLVGAGCLVTVVLTHLFEAVHWFSFMHWGLEPSVGHYLDLSSAILGLTMFPIGFFFAALTRSRG